MKAILVIDMPDSCFHCPLESYRNQCGANHEKTAGNANKRPSWCPLKPMPKWTINRNCAFSEKGGAIPDEWVYDFLTEIMGETE